MDNTDNVQTGMFTPSRETDDRSRVRRNLSMQFENEVTPIPRGPSSPYRTTQHQVSETEHGVLPEMLSRGTPISGIREQTDIFQPDNQVQTEKRTGYWTRFLGWCVLFMLTAILCLGVLYYYYPVYLLTCFTREFFMTCAYVVLLLSIGLIVIKLLGYLLLSPGIGNALNNGYYSNTPRQRHISSTSGIQYQQIQIKRTFKGDGTDIWSEFIRYFENIALINDWPMERKLKVFFTVLRGQAETYAYGLSPNVRDDWDLLKTKMDDRFGHKAMKESYVSEAKMRKKQSSESFRDFGQTIEDLYRRAYPSNHEYVEESSMKTFLDNCSESGSFRMAVKRMRPKTLQEAVTFAMQEECIRVGETTNDRDNRKDRRPVYQVRQRTQENKQKYLRKNGQYKTKNNTKILTCFECGSKEHLRNKCPVLKRDHSKPNRTDTNDKNTLNLERPRQ